jgi:hypothetical protein
MTSIELIAAERERQKTVEGWTPEHDDAHVGGELSWAAACYTNVGSAVIRGAVAEEFPADMMIDHGDWPGDWDASWWKPSDDPIRNLVKAGALIAAEIDRLQRLAALSRPEAAEPQEESAERTLKSIAGMLGWMNMPPRRIFEMEIAAMKARIRELSARPEAEPPKETNPQAASGIREFKPPAVEPGATLDPELEFMLRDLRERGCKRNEPCGVHNEPQWTCGFCLHNVLERIEQAHIRAALHGERPDGR